jgi:AcrR family transcriptional regulator
VTEQKTSKRQYRGTIQAEVAALTRQRILNAAMAMFSEQWIDQITLDQIARLAGVTVQTVLRHFQSAEGLWVAAGRLVLEQIKQLRDNVAVGDIPAIVHNIVNFYELTGPGNLRSLAIEGRFPAFDVLIQEGRAFHQDWTARVFAPYLARCTEPDQTRLLAELVALCDVYVWKTLRLDYKLSIEQTEQAVEEMIVALLGQKTLLSVDPS